MHADMCVAADCVASDLRCANLYVQHVGAQLFSRSPCHDNSARCDIYVRAEAEGSDLPPTCPQCRLSTVRLTPSASGEISSPCEAPIGGRCTIGFSPLCSIFFCFLMLQKSYSSTHRAVMFVSQEHEGQAVLMLDPVKQAAASR